MKDVLTDAASWTGAERHISVIMPVCRVFREEIVRVEFIGVGELVGASMESECGHDHGGTDWDDVVTGRYIQTKVDHKLDKNAKKN